MTKETAVEPTTPKTIEMSGNMIARKTTKAYRLTETV